MMKKHSVVITAALFTSLVLVIAGVAQLVLMRLWLGQTVLQYIARHNGVVLRHGTPPPALRRAVWTAAILSNLVIASLAGLLVGTVARSRLRPLVGALHRVAQGDFTVRLPPSREAELAAVQTAFTTMTRALDEAIRKLAQADAQRRRLFADLAHELATPASVIAGLVDTLARPDLAPTERDRARLFGALEHQAAHLSALVTDVRDLAALDDLDVALPRVPMDLGERVASIVERFVVDDPIGTPITCAPCEAWALVDEARLAQLLANLLRNARRYTPAHGTIQVTLVREGDAVVLAVDDSGPGVPDAVLAQLGERLFRVDPSRDRRTGGYGLGLALARSIVERHEGRIRFERSAQGGLRAVITLPTIGRPDGSGTADEDDT